MGGIFIFFIFFIGIALDINGWLVSDSPMDKEISIIGGTTIICLSIAVSIICDEVKRGREESSHSNRAESSNAEARRE